MLRNMGQPSLQEVLQGNKGNMWNESDTKDKRVGVPENSMVVFTNGRSTATKLTFQIMF